MGAFLFRPSSQGQAAINITWKLYKRLIIHLLIKEGHKKAGEQISGSLILDKTEYDSLDSIIQNYIRPINHFVADISRHKKFQEFEIDFVKDKLL